MTYLSAMDQDANPPGGAKPARACPICGKPAAERFRPFCSARCRLIDLGRWIGERYRIPAEEETDGEREEE